MKILNAKKFPLGRYDSGTKTKKSLKTKKALDITSFCPTFKPGRRIILLYGESVRGRFVVIRDESLNGYRATHEYFYQIDRLDGFIQGGNHEFSSLASKLGFTAYGLAALLSRNAPQKRGRKPAE